MKKLCVVLGVLGLFAVIAGVQVEAQMQPVPPPVAGSPLLKGSGGGYNPANVETLVGQVMAVKRTTPKKTGQDILMILVLKTDRETINVNVGPAAFADQQNMGFATGDQVQVKGSRVQRPRSAVIIAGEVKKGDKTLLLRDEKGRPLWPRKKMQPGY